MSGDTPGACVPIQAGAIAPSFSLPAILTDARETTVDLADALALGPVLLLFYEDDGMPICTRELRAFAQDYELLRAAGVQVFGINSNGLGSHAKFQERDRFPFALISDFHGDTVKAYGLWDAGEGKSRRAIVVVGEDGRVRHVEPHFNPGNINAVVATFAALGLAEG